MKIKTSQANNFCFPFKYSILDAWLAGRAKKKQQQRLHQKNVNRIIGRSRQQQQWGRERDSRRDKEREGAFETHRELMFISIAGNFVNYDRQTLLPREREGYSWREREGARWGYMGKRGAHLRHVVSDVSMLLYFFCPLLSFFTVAVKNTTRKISEFFLI